MLELTWAYEYSIHCHLLQSERVAIQKQGVLSRNGYAWSASISKRNIKFERKGSKENDTESSSYPRPKTNYAILTIRLPTSTQSAISSIEDSHEYPQIVSERI